MPNLSKNIIIALLSVFVVWNIYSLNSNGFEEFKSEESIYYKYGALLAYCILIVVPILIIRFLKSKKSTHPTR